MSTPSSSDPHYAAYYLAKSFAKQFRRDFHYGSSLHLNYSDQRLYIKGLLEYAHEHSILIAGGSMEKEDDPGLIEGHRFDARIADYLYHLYSILESRIVDYLQDFGCSMTEIACGDDDDLGPILPVIRIILTDHGILSDAWESDYHRLRKAAGHADDIHADTPAEDNTRPQEMPDIATLDLANIATTQQDDTPEEKEFQRHVMKVVWLEATFFAANFRNATFDGNCCSRSINWHGEEPDFYNVIGMAPPKKFPWTEVGEECDSEGRDGRLYAEEPILEYLAPHSTTRIVPLLGARLWKDL